MTHSAVSMPRRFSRAASPKLLARTSAAVALVVSTMALGQEASSGQGGSAALEEMIVTARRVEEPLQRTPVSVTAVSAAELTERGAVNIADVANAAPSLSIRSAAASKNSAVITTRGQVQNDTLMTVDPAVGVYVDDVYYARAYSVLGDLLDVENVQVLKGPQGTLYGRNTIGGAIKIATRKPAPDEGFGGLFRAGYGDFDAIDVTGAVNIPVVQDTFALRVAGSYHDRDGYTTSYLVNEPNLTPVRKIDTDDQHTYSARLSARWIPTDAFTLDLSGSVFDADENGAMAVGLYGDVQRYIPGRATNGTRALFANSPQRARDFWAGLTDSVPYARTRVRTVASAATYDINDALTTKLILGYVKGENNASTNAAGSVTDFLEFLDFQPVLNQEQRQYSAEYQLIGKAFGDRLSWLAGWYYFDEKGSEEGPGETRVTGILNATNFAGEVRNTSQSVFANAIYSITDRLRVNAGLRYTEDKKDIDGHSRATSNLPPTPRVGVCVYAPGPGITTSTTSNGPCSFERSDSFDYWTYEVGADYQFTNGIFGYLKTGNGYRSGGQQLRAVGGQSVEPFDPDQVINYEAGIKTDLLGRRLRLNLAAYHSEFKETQQTVIAFISGTTTTIVQNLGDAKIDGFEFESALALGRLTLSGGVGYAKFEYDDSTKQQVYSPEWTANAAATYVQPTPWGDLNGRLDYYYSGSFKYTADKAVPDDTIDGHHILNARLELELSKSLEVALWGKNLTEEEYYTYALVSAYNPLPVQGGPYYGARGGYVGAPRTFGADVQFKF